MLTRRSATQPWGHPNHARNVVKALRAKHGRDQLYVPNAKRTAGTLTYDGSDVGGERVCLEIEQEELALIASRGGKIIKLSVVGYDNECEDRDGKVLAVERAEERAATAPGKELALLPWQLEAIWDLDALGWRKNLVWIQRHWHAHAAHHHPDGQVGFCRRGGRLLALAGRGLFGLEVASASEESRSKDGRRSGE